MATPSISEVEKELELLREKLTDLETEVPVCKQLEQNLQEATQCFQPYQPYLNLEVPAHNGTESALRQAKTFLQITEDKALEQKKKFLDICKNLKSDFKSVYEELRNMTKKLVGEVKQWQDELKLKYAELGTDTNIDFQSLATRCARLGELLREVLGSDIPRLENSVSDVTGIEDIYMYCTQLKTDFSVLLHSFYQRTFIVVSQEHAKHDAWNIRTSGAVAYGPKVILRILGADTLKSLGGLEICACFVKESQINECYDVHKETLNINVLEEKAWKMKSGKSTKFVCHPSSSVFEGSLNIELNSSVKRKNVPVFRDKYRLIFYTHLEKETLWTMSLPMVVTTGGVQQCQCLASVMWQCFSTDVFALPVKPLPDLPWHRVAKMLQAKVGKISSRSLTEEDILHLKERLLGGAAVTDDTNVALDQFCTNSLHGSKDEKKEEFTFWKWFLSLYNLIRTHVQDLWEKGWICFLSKEATEKKLSESKTYKPGTFLLRFSDQNIDNSQAKDSVFGKVATSVLVKNSGNGRLPIVEHVDLIGQERLKKAHLVNVLLQTMDSKNRELYRFLYQNRDIPSKELFAEYNSKPVPKVPGYTGVQNTFKAELEEIDGELSKLELEGKRTSDLSFETDLDSDTDEISTPEVSEPKRLKTNVIKQVPSDTEFINMDKSAIITDEIKKTAEQLSEDSSRKSMPTLRCLLTEPKTGNEVSEIPSQNVVNMVPKQYTDTTLPLEGPSPQTNFHANSLPTEISDHEGGIPEMVSSTHIPTSQYDLGRDISNIPFATGFEENHWNSNIQCLDEILEGSQNFEKNACFVDKQIPDANIEKYYESTASVRDCDAGKNSYNPLVKCHTNHNLIPVQENQSTYDSDTAEGLKTFEAILASKRRELTDENQESSLTDDSELANILKSFEPEMEGMIPMQSQSPIYNTEAVNATSDMSNGLSPEMIKSYIENLSPEKMMELVPLKKIIEIFTSHYKTLPSDKKQSVISALQDSMQDQSNNIELG